MNREPVIHVGNLSKSFDVYRKPQDYLREMLTRKTLHDVFWALRDVSFDVLEKQRVGIIGPNGAGKSTLLRILTGNLQPSSGNLQVNGRVSALLSMTSSLNPEESGLENIKFNLLLNGVPKARINELAEDIIDFAELGNFIYSPVKTYSSGMNARLSFGIATAMEPEIMVVDEVLSVGDGYFLGKAYKRMMHLVERGKALIFVSHSVNEVRKLCDTVIWLENGNIRMHGEAAYVCTQYEEDYQNNRKIETKKKNKKKYQDFAVTGVTLDLLQTKACIMRIVPRESNKHFKDIHYIRKVGVGLSGSEPTDVPLELTEITPSTLAWLDILDSEWGRIYTRNGVSTRTLSYQTGKMRGGIMMYRMFAQDPNSPLKIEARFEANSAVGTENLGLDFFDFRTKKWQEAEIVKVEKGGDGWENCTCCFEMGIPSQEQVSQAMTTYQEKAMKDAEIVDAWIVADEEAKTVLIERQPFEVHVKFRANRPIPSLDVVLVIFRSDGVLVFIQSAGMVDKNMSNPVGESTVRFLFENNALGAGTYYINVFVKDGWEWDKPMNNYEIFDVKINIQSFQIVKEYNIDSFDFGIVNMRVPVKLPGDA